MRRRRALRSYRSFGTHACRYLWGRDDERVVVRPEVQRVRVVAGEWFEKWTASE